MKTYEEYKELIITQSKGTPLETIEFTTLYIFSNIGRLSDSFLSDDRVEIRGAIGYIFSGLIILGHLTNHQFDKPLKNSVHIKQADKHELFKTLCVGIHLRADHLMLVLERLAKDYMLTLEECIESIWE